MSLGEVFGSDINHEVGVILRENGSHKSDFADVFVRIHSLMIYTDLIEYSVVVDTKATFPLFWS